MIWLLLAFLIALILVLLPSIRLWLDLRRKARTDPKVDCHIHYTPQHAGSAFRQGWKG